MTYSGPVYDGGAPPPVDDRPRVINRTVQTVKAGASFGSALAIAISWSVNKSIVWAIIHGVFSWLYVLYYAMTRD
jgi:hypothetical protein